MLTASCVDLWTGHGLVWTF